MTAKQEKKVCFVISPIGEDVEMPEIHVSNKNKKQQTKKAK